MNQEQKTRYQRLQGFVYALQQEVWTIKEIDKKTAFAEVVSFAQNILGIKIAPIDPKFLIAVQLKLNELLPQPEEQPVPNIPPNLQEMVETYEKHLQESRIQTQKFIFPTLDEQIKALQRQYAEKIRQQLIAGEEQLAQNPTLAEEISLNITNQIVMTLPQVVKEEAFSEKEYQEILVKIQPIITQELERAGIEKPKAKIETRETFEDAKSLAATPHAQIAPKPPVAPVEIPQAPQPKISDLPYFFKQSTGIGVSFGVRTQTAIKKAALAPIAKPLQWLIHLAPEEFRASHPGLVYAATGFTNVVAQQAFEQTWKIKPKSPEVGFWHNLTTTFQEEKPPFLGVFRNYYQWDWLGKVGTKVETFTPSRFFTFRSSFWRIFKSSRIGGLISRGAGKLIAYLPKITRFLGLVGAAIAGWETFKKAGKIFLGYLGGLFMIAAHYGPLAVAGLTGGLAIGFPFAILAAKAVGVAVTGFFSFLGPFAIIPGVVSGVLTFFIVEGVFGLVGLVGGIGAQILIDKLGAALSGTSLPQIGTAGLTQASVATTATAGWFAPAAVATATIGGLIISQVVSGAFFIPSEEVMLTSPYIQVTKTVEFSGTIGDSINYTIQVKAVDKDLTKVKVVDQATATCRGSSPDLEEHSWNGNISIPAGGVWEQTYTVTTNDQFNDCLINNIARVTAIVEGKTEESFAVGYVSIGNPPEVIPWGLPIHDNPDRGTGYTFGQMVPCFTDPTRLCPHEGIDVHGPLGTTVYSTFPQESRVTQVGFGQRAGNYIMLSSGKYQIFMGHLAQKPNFKINDPVGANAPVGIQGDSGSAWGEHVHYQIWENGGIVDPRSFGVPSPPW